MSNESLSGEAGGHSNGVDPNATAALQDAARKLCAQAADLGDQAYRQAMDAGRYAARQVKEQPLSAALVSGVLGLLFGFVLARSSAPRPRTARDYVDDYLPRQLRKR
jgi:ElaB/YqjD/DUF883 family membrane-anchored ribosome-binding protein